MSKVKKMLLTLLTTLSIPALTMAQEETASVGKWITVGVGIGSFEADANNFNIRELGNSNYYWEDVDVVSEDAIYTQYLSAKYEFNLNKYFGVAAGLRFNHYNSSFNYDNDRAIYWEIVNNTEKLEYTKIEYLKHNSAYLGIPIEIKYSITPKAPVSVFAKAGAQFGFKLYSENTIEFASENGKKNESLLDEQIGESDGMVNELYLNVGVRFGRRIPFNCELTLPSVMVGTASSIYNTESNSLGIGFQISTSIPLSK